MIKGIFQKARSNEMVNTSFYTGSASVLAMIAGLVVNKVIALTIGPSGIALVSQFKNFVSIATSASTLGIQKGVVKYLAEFRDDLGEKKKIFSTSVRITVGTSIVLGAAIFLSSGFWSAYLLESDNYVFVFRLFGVTVVMFSLNMLLMSILNGLGEIKKLVWVKMSNSLFALFFTSVATFYFGLSGALVALALSQSVVLIITLFIVYRTSWFKFDLFKDPVSKKYLKLLLAFSLMAVCSMVLGPAVKIAIRNFIIDNLSTIQAGYWDATFLISTAYLNVITTTLAIYYLPKLSNLKQIGEIRNEIWSGYKILIPVITVGFTSVYFLREYIIILLYSAEFLEMEYLLKPQLIGDFFKISSFILSYLMLAKAKTTLFITTEIFFSLFYYVLAIYMINEMGLVGAVWAHAANYFVYLLVMLIVFRRYVFR